jgi:hypothetical protein
MCEIGMIGLLVAGKEITGRHSLAGELRSSFAAIRNHLIGFGLGQSLQRGIHGFVFGPATPIPTFIGLPLARNTDVKVLV